MAIFRIIVLLQIKSWTFWYIDRLPTLLHTGVIHIKNGPVLLAHPVVVTLELWELYWCGAKFRGLNGWRMWTRFDAQTLEPQNIAVKILSPSSVTSAECFWFCEHEKQITLGCPAVNSIVKAHCKLRRVHKMAETCCSDGNNWVIFRLEF